MVLPLELEVVEDVQKANKEGMFTAFVKERSSRGESNQSNPDHHVEIQTFSLEGLVLKNSSKRKESEDAGNYSCGYTGGYSRGGGNTLGSP